MTCIQVAYQTVKHKQVWASKNPKIHRSLLISLGPRSAAIDCRIPKGKVTLVNSEIGNSWALARESGSKPKKRVFREKG